jgi:hypothetical protein
MSMEKQSPFHQKGEQGLLFKDLGTPNFPVNIGPFDQMFKFESVARPSLGNGSQTLEGVRTAVKVLLPDSDQGAHKQLARDKTAGSSV